MSSLTSNCAASALPFPIIYGADFQTIQASLIQNFSTFVPYSNNPNSGDVHAQNLHFCNVTITHTHPGTHDKLTTKIFLPIQPPWNERLQAVGGGGWVAGLHPIIDDRMYAALAGGYATVTTDGGVPSSNVADDWALLSPGNVDLYALQNFASVSINDATLAAKSIVRRFYNKAPKYSYFSGCSQGGRQGIMAAQRYPELFDGIAAAAPAIYYPQLFVSAFFPQQVMNEMGKYPHACELDALTRAAIKACDAEDGKVDGLIANPDACHFDPFSIVGKEIDCADSGSKISISEVAAKVAEAAWNGSRASDGSFLWYSYGYETNLTADACPAQTTCSTNGTCTGVPRPIWTDWIRLFVKKDAKFNSATMSRKEYEGAFIQGVREFDSVIGTSGADLRDFRNAGGKMITYHGMADMGIPFRNTRHYYDAVRAISPNIHDFYRLFEAPGLSHCTGGAGGQPLKLFEALVQWVEEGVAPGSLEAINAFNQTNLLCPYPQRAVANASIRLSANGQTSSNTTASALKVLIELKQPTSGSIRATATQLSDLTDAKLKRWMILKEDYNDRQREYAKKLKALEELDNYIESAVDSSHQPIFEDLSTPYTKLKALKKRLELIPSQLKQTARA
ncbi:tannase-domain-containing protein [Lojkania enalia]|uniref:Carboxylic ester hydrolase n=1 Tax=Lojkania enalia TaxID=147567 RepID=A0A9P4JVK7_9PLEO|nr:tannase-domain-containing protein [Didymosphaeria enalia]